MDRQDKIVASLALPIGVLTALGSLLGILVRGYSNEFLLLNWFFYPFVAGAALAFTTALYFVIRAYFGQTYEYLPRLRELHDYETGLVAYYRETGQDEATAKASAAAEFEEYLAGKIIEAGSVNAFNNDEKSAFRYRANWAVVAVLLLTILSGVPYVIDQSIRKPAVPTVHVDNLDATLKEIADGERTPAGGATAAPASPPAPAGAGEPNDQRGAAPDTVAPSAQPGPAPAPAPLR